MRFRIQIKPLDSYDFSKSLVVHDKDVQAVKNKIKFLFDSLEKAEEKTHITVYKSEVDKILKDSEKRSEESSKKFNEVQERIRKLL